MIRRTSLLLAAFALILAACSSPPPAKSGQGEVSVSPTRTPKPSAFAFMKGRPLTLAKPSGGSIDLRHRDLSDKDLSQAGELLSGYADFDTATRWPAVLPVGFTPDRFLALGKDPGLGVRELHKQGITGKGVRVAFLDQALLVDHEEYRDRIEAYRQIGTVDDEAQMHASAVLSLLAGKSIGVAPEVKVTYYADENLSGGSITWISHAKAIQEILDKNIDLPPEQRIRVIGVSLGYVPDMAGYKEIKEAVARAKREGVLVLTTAVDADYKLNFNGLNRDPLADPNDLASYQPGMFWQDWFYKEPKGFTRSILVPMDSRTTAGPGGTSEYTFYRVGGASWAVPYLEGIYALGLQVKPDMTPDEFYQAALDTGSYTQVTHDGKSYKLGPIVNPAALIARLQKK